jgi:hypothetical protein
MPATNYTPIQLYRTNTASGTAPSAGNLNAGELAINYNDGGMILYAKNTTGNVIKLMNNPANLLYPTADGAANTVIKTNGSGTLTFAKLVPNVSSTASASSVTPDVSLYDMYAYTALAANLTINAPTGSPSDGQTLLFRILDNGTSRTLTWNATFTAIGASLPTATTANKMIYVGCIYNVANTRWDVISVATQV